eukprot:CAMPEP_0197488562 /NCGR_PEP_ID=MMETSP1311-20131121/3497_1 /TAXON_ID=464262 /ORGANISM="Genus nov. species nov., Strain RCC856" /LENGTH=231 /DNA_ID=CAMNT_0043032645 /DNA_START=90 /DNA_END=785 /DNA_ORIENTATION=-
MSVKRVLNVGIALAMAYLVVVSCQDAPANETAPADAPASDPMASLPPECQNLDPTTLDTSNPAALASLLPCTGWDQTCQSNVMAAGASCIQEIQAIVTWLQSSGTADQVENATGLSAANATSDPSAIANETASIGADITPDQAKEEITSRLPALKEALGTCCGGSVTPTCCAAMDPIVSGGCLCQQQPVELLKSFLGQEPSQFIGVAADILGQLGCSALNDAKVSPDCSRR